MSMFKPFGKYLLKRADKNSLVKGRGRMINKQTNKQNP